jgi:Tetratricopeptide repeat
LLISGLCPGNRFTLLAAPGNGNLATVLAAQGDLEGARRLHERALAIRETRLGPDHPHTAESRRQLAALTSDLEGAE